MNVFYKLFAVALAGAVTFWGSVAIQQAWVVLSPFWATCATLTGAIGLFGWWLVTAAFLDSES
jgi:hypothetical protein